MRDKLNKRMLAVKNRDSKEHRDKACKAIKKRYAKHKDVINQAVSLRAMYGKSCFCRICGEDRAIDFCHIIPISKGGSSEVWNIIPLCPTHHHLFDHKKLNEHEIALIDDSCSYALLQHQIVI